MNEHVAKIVAALVVIAALISLAFIAIKTKGDSTETRGALAFVETPGNVAARLPGPVAIATTGSDSDDIVGGITTQRPAASPTQTPSPEESAPGGRVAAQLTCPAPLPSATRTGGVANLTAIIPLFGPFSAEAFTFLPAFEPAFPVIGPFFPIFEAMLAAGQPLLDAGVPVVNALEQSGYDAFAPFYGEIRPQVLAGEAQAAATLRPVVEQLATTDGSGCVANLADIVATVVLGVVP